MSGLPDEVLDLLAAHGPVKLVARANGQTTTVQPAPLSRELFLLAPRTSAILGVLEGAPDAEIMADDPGGAYTIRIRGRAVPGRRASTESRRSELMHWLPEGGTLQSLVAVRFYPETLDFSKPPKPGQDERWRASGPVPGSELPPVGSRWARLCTFGMTGGVAFSLAMSWFWILVVAEEPHKRVVLLLAFAASAVSLLVAAVLQAQLWAFARWREGTGPAAPAELLVAGWVGPPEVRSAAVGAAALGLGLAALLGVVGSSTLFTGALLASGVWWYVPYHTLRHLMRREDAAEGGR